MLPRRDLTQAVRRRSVCSSRPLSASSTEHPAAKPDQEQTVSAGWIGNVVRGLDGLVTLDKKGALFSDRKVSMFVSAKEASHVTR
jgi:hypothetical protein